MFQRVVRFLVGVKMRIQRSTSWLTLFNSAMIFFLFLSKLKEFGYNIDIGNMFIPLLVVSFVVLVLLGYMEDKLGFWRMELKQISERNPHYIETMERLNKIEKRLDELATNMESNGRHSIR